MIEAVFTQALQTLLLIGLAPLLLGWVNQCRAWMQNRTGPGLMQPYRVLHKLFHKDAVVADHASSLFRAAPYVQFGCMALVAAIVPVLATTLPYAAAADAIALVGLFALARLFAALSAMDVGTAFGSMGARRVMLVGFLAEPALLMVFFTPSLIAHSTSLPTIVEALAGHGFVLYPSLAFAAIAFAMVALAENARIPVDNPATHLELTMIHEAMILEYSARHLALIEWASALKLINFAAIGIALFVPWGIVDADDWMLTPVAIVALILKLVAAGFALAVFESLSAKLRIFRAPEFLATAFLLAVLGMLIRLALEQ